MGEHPIENLMITAMNSIQNMVDVNTIVGEPIQSMNGITIIPISKVSFGFAAGGSEFKGETIDEYTKREKEEAIQYRLPFGGGSGAGVSIAPVAFLVVQPNNVKLLPVEHCSAIDRLLDYVPDLMEKANIILNKNIQNKKEEMKNQEKIKNQVKEILEKDELEQQKENNNQVKARPKYTKVHRPEPIDYEYEYDESEESEDK